VAVIALLAVFAVVPRDSHSTSHSTSHSGLAKPTLTVESATIGHPIPAGFVGLSMEFRGLEEYVGQDPHALNPAFVALLRDIAPNQRRVLRIGGDSTDWTWWPVSGTRQPPGVKYSLTTNWMDVAHALASTLGARLILGVNLEADNRTVASAEGRAMVARVGRNAIDALEIGNEPELYGSFGWYKGINGQQVPGRPPGYSEPDFVHDFSSFASTMPNVALAGPSSGSAAWLASLGSFLRSEPRVRLATVHAYPLKHCGHFARVSIGQLLSDQASHGLAQTLAPYVALASAHHAPLRVDEMNAITCGGQRGVSNAFVSSLWAVDTLFELARTGVYGVDIQTVPNTINEVVGATQTGGTWQVRVHPEYYGLIMFAQAAPAGARLLRLSNPAPAGVKVWGTRGPDGHIRVVVINKHAQAAAVVKLRIAGAHGTATVEQLRAPSPGATSGVTLGGQTFGATSSTGELAGRSTDTALGQTGGNYVLSLPAASASLLTVPTG
jgi:hypothetical protein